MSPRVRVIRFARVTEPTVTPDGHGVVAQLWLHDHPSCTGRILRSDTGWHYELADGTATGLSSPISRQDLERQIMLWHLGPLSDRLADPVATPEWFAAAS